VPPPPPQGPLTAVQEEILDYVDHNPTAADTADGVYDVWLGGRRSLRRVIAALDRLVASGALVSRELPDGRILFSGSGAGRER